MHVKNLHEEEASGKSSEAVSTRRRSRASSKDNKGGKGNSKASGFPSPDGAAVRDCTLKEHNCEVKTLPHL